MSQSEDNDRFRELLQNSPIPITRIEEREYKGVKHLQAVIEHADPRRVITIDNYGFEITVYIDTHHTHHPPYRDPGSSIDEGFEEAMDWVKDIIEGRIFICTTYRGDRIAWTSSTRSIDDLIAPRGKRIEVLRYPDSVIHHIPSR